MIERICTKEKKIREEALKVEREKILKKGKLEGKKEKVIEIAKGLKKDGISIEIISKNTGLSIKEIERLKQEVQIKYFMGLSYNTCQKRLSYT